MKNKEEIKEELKGLSPFLWEQKGKPEGFDVPKDYFSSLPDELLGKLSARAETIAVEEKENWLDQLIKSLQYFFQPRYALAYAAVALLLVAGIYYKGLGSGKQQVVAAATILDELPDEVLNEYISENIDEFDEATLSEQLAENIDPLSRLQIETSDELMDELIDGLDEEDLEDLL